jgi:Tol biopolymer transport system component
MAQRFDSKRLELTGEAAPIADQVHEDEVSLRSAVSVSQNGLLVYLAGSGPVSRELIWLDRSGKKVGQVPGVEAYIAPRISPNGKRIVYTLSSPAYDIWSYDIERSVKTRLTFASNSGEGDLSPVWSADGTRIAYTNARAGVFGFLQKSADGSGSEEILLEGTNSVKYPTDWSPDGKFLAYQQATAGVNGIWILPLSGERKPISFVESRSIATFAAFSPDGKWLAFCSTESGEQNVYVMQFPGPGGKWQISRAGGCYPHWRRDQKELFYLSSDDKIMVAAVSVNGPSFVVGGVTPLFETFVYRSQVGAYDVTADGQRFIIPYEPAQSNAAITLIENWDAGLQK